MQGERSSHTNNEIDHMMAIESTNHPQKYYLTRETILLISIDTKFLNVAKGAVHP